MMLSSSLVLLQPYWPVLFLIKAALFNITSICYAQEDTCETLGCLTPFKSKNACQCDVHCRYYANCCDDFFICEKTCQFIGCGSDYNQYRPCQCDDRCHGSFSCCIDYNDICASMEQTTSDIRPVYCPTIESPEKCTNAAAVVFTTLGVVVLIISIIMLVYYVSMRRRRTHEVNEERVEDRNYYEVRHTNERSYENVFPNNKGKRFDRNIGSNTSAIKGHDGQFVANMAYKSYR